MGEDYNDKWINLEEAAEYLSADIPIYKIGKLWKIKKSELDEWVKSGNSANL